MKEFRSYTFITKEGEEKTGNNTYYSSSINEEERMREIGSIIADSIKEEVRKIKEIGK